MKRIKKSKEKKKLFCRKLNKFLEKPQNSRDKTRPTKHQRSTTILFCIIFGICVKIAKKKKNAHKSMQHNTKQIRQSATTYTIRKCNKMNAAKIFKCCYCRWCCGFLWFHQQIFFSFFWQIITLTSLLPHPQFLNSSVILTLAPTTKEFNFRTTTRLWCSGLKNPYVNSLSHHFDQRLHSQKKNRSRSLFKYSY